MWEGKLMPPGLTVEWSMKQINDRKEAMKTVIGPTINSGNKDGSASEIKWQCPDSGQLKINVDASIFPGSSFFTIGMVLRYQNELFVEGKNAKFSGCVTVMEAEAVGVYEALVWACSRTSQHVIVESDSQLVVNV